MSPAEHLRAAKALIDTPEKWTRDHSARTDSGEPVATGDGDACRFCALGAVWRVFGDCIGSGLRKYESALEAALPGEWVDVAAFNDAETTTHPDIMALFDRAITLAEQSA